MKRSDICSFLKGNVSPEQFSITYAEELRSHIIALEKKGASAPILLTGNEYILLNRKNLRRLVRYVMSGAISRELGTYLLDALSLDDNVRFTDENLRQTVLDLADSELDEDGLYALSVEGS